jgi:peptidoglycan/LPS O-acetylase OafA/YrhL
MRQTATIAEVSPPEPAPPDGKAAKAGALPPKLSQMLFFARWAGMLLVLGVHATTSFMYFNGFAAGDQPLFIAAWRFCVNYAFGREAVIGFFVMSGFLVGGAVLGRINSEKPFLFDYLVHRIVRIYMVVIPAILLTAAFDMLGRTLFPPDYGAYPVFEGHYEPRYILTNLLNFQGVIATHFGTNGPLWSIGYEFWYYVAFPMLLLPWMKSAPPRTARFGFILAFIFCLAISLHQIWFPFGFLIWSLGAAITLAKRPIMRSANHAALLLIVVNLFAGVVFSNEVIHVNPWAQYVSDTLSALAFANLILTMRFPGDEKWRFLDWRGHQTLADFSFTLYAIHNPTLMLLRASATAVLGKDWDWGAGSATLIQWFALGLAMSLTILLAWLLSFFTEKKVPAVRRFVHDRLLGKRYGTKSPASA